MIGCPGSSPFSFVPFGTRSSMARASLALDNLRALVILLVLSFHSVLAYLNFLPASPFAFDTRLISGAPFRSSIASDGSVSSSSAPGRTSF